MYSFDSMTYPVLSKEAETITPTTNVPLSIVIIV